jgi:hypothetical protein
VDSQGIMLQDVFLKRGHTTTIWETTLMVVLIKVFNPSNSFNHVQDMQPHIMVSLEDATMVNNTTMDQTIDNSREEDIPITED